MNILKIGIVKEGKIPVDRRVVLTPVQAMEINKREDIQISIEKSNIRTYTDDEYANQGLVLSDDINDCEVILGVKEVPIPNLIPGKTYFMFSHTIKSQPYNRSLLQDILKKKIRLIDWECLTNIKGQRLIAFGRYAGIVGAYNGILTFGRKSVRFELRPAHTCHDLEDLKTEFSKVDLPQIKIVITGGGRVAGGAKEVLDGMGILHVTPDDFLTNSYSHPVYTQLEVTDYNKKKNGTSFEQEEFFQNPQDFDSDFKKFSQVSNILIAAAFWDPKAPELFTRNESREGEFLIDVIADITCDIEGSIPSTLKSSTIDDPIYDYNPITGLEEPPLSNDSNITVMSVDNLPCELPRDASIDFGRDFISYILEPLLGNDPEGIIEKATIAKDGNLTSKFSYLQGYVEEDS